MGSLLWVRRPSSGHNWYIDSAAAPGGDGLTLTTAFDTVADLEAAVIGAGDRIYATGTFCEQLDIVVNNVSVIGDAVFNASDIQSNASFAKTGGYTNIYEISVALEGDGTSDWVNAWEDGSFLSRETFDTDLATTLTNLDSNAGNYYPTAETGTITLYIHAGDSSDVTASGKTYECSVREYGINVTGSGARLNGIECKNNLSNSGSLKALRSITLRNCIFRNGNKHNALVGDGAKIYGCTFVDAHYESSFSLLVYNEDTPAGLGVLISNSTFLMNGTLDSSSGAIEGHINVAGNYGVVSLANNIFQNFNAAIVCRDFTSLLSSGNTFINAGDCYRTNESAVYTLTDDIVTSTVTSRYISTGINGATINISGLALNVDSSATGTIFNNHTNTTIALLSCDLEGTGFNATTGLIANSNKSDFDLTVNDTRLAINDGNIHRMITLAPSSYVGDNNVYKNSNALYEMRSAWGATGWLNDLSDFQTATSQDGNSTVES